MWKQRLATMQRQIVALYSGLVDVYLNVEMLTCTFTVCVIRFCLHVVSQNIRVFFFLCFLVLHSVVLNP